MSFNVIAGNFVIDNNKNKIDKNNLFDMEIQQWIYNYWLKQWRVQMYHIL